VARTLQREGRLSLDADPRLEPLRSPSEEVRDASWRQLYDDEYRRVARLVSRFGVAPADLEDVTQQVFLAAYRRLAEVADVRDVRAWLGGIAVRTASDHRRWRRVRRANEWMVEAIYQRQPRDRWCPGQDLERTRLERRVEDVLRRMSPKLRPVMLLCEIEEVEPGAVAAILDIPLNTVRSRRRLARQSFEKLWREAELDG
jgi:RNA polymerase sigma-70 factor (ECF subfamily)